MTWAFTKIPGSLVSVAFFFSLRVAKLHEQEILSLSIEKGSIKLKKKSRHRILGYCSLYNNI
jgi:hypothetical protein